MTIWWDDLRTEGVEAQGFEAEQFILFGAGSELELIFLALTPCFEGNKIDLEE